MRITTAISSVRVRSIKLSPERGGTLYRPKAAARAPRSAGHLRNRVRQGAVERDPIAAAMGFRGAAMSEHKRGFWDVEGRRRELSGAAQPAGEAVRGGGFRDGPRRSGGGAGTAGCGEGGRPGLDAVLNFRDTGAAGDARAVAGAGGVAAARSTGSAGGCGADANTLTGSPSNAGRRDSFPEVPVVIDRGAPEHPRHARKFISIYKAAGVRGISIL